MNRMTLKEVAEVTGFNYSSMRQYIARCEKELVSQGVLEVKETLLRKKYFVLVEPERFIESLRETLKSLKSSRRQK